MSTLLTINASPRGEMSISRRLGERYIHHWLAAHPGGTVAERDLMKPAIPYMNVDWIGGVYAPPAVPRTPEMLAALALSETLIGELVNADQVLICTPMYNYSIPAVLKSWIDYLVRPGFTFKLAPGWPGMLADKPTRLLIATRDVHDPESEDDQVTPVVRRAFSFMGIRDVASLLAGGSLGVNRGEVRLEDHVTRFEQAIAALVA
jgi:FMN-dependent NADH-azoreductase